MFAYQGKTIEEVLSEREECTPAKTPRRSERLNKAAKSMIGIKYYNINPNQVGRNIPKMIENSPYTGGRSFTRQ